MKVPFAIPSYAAEAFNCPICHAYAQQRWADIYRKALYSQHEPVDHLSASKCDHCKNWIYWHNKKIIIPDVTSAPPANEDLNSDIQSDYSEAASILTKSPRGAAALLRLCIQKLCAQLGEKGKSIDEDIGSLVAKGLDVRIQKALDIVRVVGNEAVHPGEMDLRDDTAIAASLFSLINAIADQMITQPRLRDDLYDKLPQTKRDGIEVRNAKAKLTPEA